MNSTKISSSAKQINELKEKIQKLINATNTVNNEQKNRLNHLFRKLDEVKEIETLEHLKKQAGDKFLKAYLLYQSISRANYQPEHLNLTNFKNVDKYLEAIDKDIELVRKEVEAEPSKPSSKKLLTWLGERIATREIKNNSDDHGYNLNCSLWVEGENQEQIITVDLKTGKIEPDRVKELLEKHDWDNKEEK